MQKRPLPTRSAPSDSEVPTLEEQVERHLGNLCQALGVRLRLVSAGDLARLSLRFGAQLSRVAADGAEAVERCADAPPGLSPLAREVRGQLSRLRALEAAEAAVERTRQRIRDEIHVCRLALAQAVDLLQEATRATLAPAPGPIRQPAALRTARRRTPHRDSRG